MVVWCDSSGTDEKIHMRTTYFHVCRPKTVDANGLLLSLKSALLRLGISVVDAENCKWLVGIGSDGASANVARGGLKGLVESKCEWLFWMWCLAHWLELAVKDALKGTCLDVVDDMLLKVYYLYEKAPKKCRELEEITSDLKGCVSIDDGGIKPIKCQWIKMGQSQVKCNETHPVEIRSIHWSALSEDHSVKRTDRAKFHAYCNKWLDAYWAVLFSSMFLRLVRYTSISWLH